MNVRVFVVHFNSIEKKKNADSHKYAHENTSLFFFSEREKFAMECEI